MTKQGKNFLIAVLVFFILTGLLLLAVNLMFQVVPIHGGSMNPTVLDGDKVVVCKFLEAQRGDVIVFYNSDKTSEHPKLIKRILAMGGDTVETRKVDGNECFFVNGEQVDETFVSGVNGTSQIKVTVPEGKFYYLGDNRGDSLDSREGNWGNIADVIGKVLLRINTVDTLQIEAVK